MDLSNFETMIEGKNTHPLTYKWMLLEIYKMSIDKIREDIDEVIKNSF